MKIIGIIPSRYRSSRSPGKPLVDIGGKPMIQRVYEQASKAKSLDQVVVATDDQRIEDCVIGFGGKVMMTSESHQNGTERCGEVAIEYPAQFYINIQGDEPFIHPEQIDGLASILNGETQLGTLVKKIQDDSLLDNPNVMKVTFDKKDEAFYFSRSCIPFVRDHVRSDWMKHHDFYKHIGIYAYRSDVLKEIVNLTSSSLELAENLEQLRWLENGYKIKVAKTHYESTGIDTPEDIDRALKQNLTS
ncbi:MAG: 3-deoxy-manno-octulosonate cytidylyltransferase [Cytophagales bacterium]|nr:3-deoxy-manno-octulosonate cytidylyltransferase [Cytophagales bacterium]